MKKALDKAIAELNKGGIIVYPTDTVWGIGGDATDANTVDKIYSIKRRAFSKSLVVLVSDLEMLIKYVGPIPSPILKILKEEGVPTTIIYNSPTGLAQNALAEDGSIAIRIPEHQYCQALLKKFGKPIISTSANISGSPTPKSFHEIELSILEDSDYVVNLEREKKSEKSSRILKINVDDEVEIIRP